MTRRDEPANVERDPVLAEHRELHEITDELRGAQSRDAVLTHLEDLHARAVKHFAREEQAGGFFDSVREKSPRHDATLATLRQDHKRFLRDAEHLIGRLRTHAAKAPLDDLVADTRQLAERFQAHEAQENELLLDVMNTDLGTGD